MVNGISTIGIIGAGTMGSGIAQVCAQAGYSVILYDISVSTIEKAKISTQKNLDFLIAKSKISNEEGIEILNRIHFTVNIQDLKVDVVIEAILEKLDLKVQLFKDLAVINGENCIYATNTSSIPITQIAAASPYPHLVVGMHFFNPAHIMKLVEVISGIQTDPKVTESIFKLAEDIGKTAVLAKDAPGFIVNRVARHFYVESLQILEEQVADFQSIDRIMEASGFKMGPFRLMDLIGVDTNYSVTESMFKSFQYAAKFRPSRIQEQLRDAGYHGRKTRKGFYTYTD